MKIVSIAPYMPFAGIPHAGGEIYRRHLELAARAHQVLVICPRMPNNEAAVGQAESVPYRRMLVEPRLRAVLPGARLAYWFFSRAIPFVAMAPFGRALLVDDRLLAELRSVDRIELQWFDAIALAPMLRRALPDTHLIGVFHDVVSQGLWRTVRRGRVPFLRRLEALVRLSLAIPLEYRVMRALDTAVVLSDKDRVLLGRRGDVERIVVMPPPLDDDDMPDQPRWDPPAVPEVLFVGNMLRRENVDAVLWLLDDIWPRVRSVIPGARLTLAGARPTPAVQRAAAVHPDVELTGYVDSLSPYYRRATVVVSPMRLGAGVKLKSATAMLWGLPVVATSVAAEGVAHDEHFFAVEDDSRAIANALITALRDPEATADVRTRAFAWARETYSSAAYVRSLEDVYR